MLKSIPHSYVLARGYAAQQLDTGVSQKLEIEASRPLACDDLTLTQGKAYAEGAWEDHGMPSPTRDMFFCLLGDWLTLANTDEDTKIKLHNVGRVLINQYQTKYADTRRKQEGTDNIEEPDNLMTIARAATTVGTYIIDKAIFLLSKANNGFFPTPTLFYQSNGSPFDDQQHSHIEKHATTFKDLARIKLTRLQPGQKLMIPLCCLDIDHNQVNPAGSHISSVLALRTDAGFKFYLFDSLDTAERNEYKENLINSLIEDIAYREFFYHGMAFQWENDCAIHCYNFFRLCTLSPECMFSAPDGMRLLFGQYVANIEKLKTTLQDNTHAASSLLRIFFVLDCIKNGYRDGYDGIDDLQEIYDLPDESPAEDEMASVGCFNNFWGRLRSNAYLKLPAWITSEK